MLEAKDVSDEIYETQRLDRVTHAENASWEAVLDDYVYLIGGGWTHLEVFAFTTSPVRRASVDFPKSVLSLCKLKTGIFNLRFGWSVWRRGRTTARQVSRSG